VLRAAGFRSGRHWQAKVLPTSFDGKVALVFGTSGWAFRTGAGSPDGLFWTDARVFQSLNISAAVSASLTERLPGGGKRGYVGT
jgi:hypothetical protein